MRIHEYSDFDFKNLPTASKVDCLFEIGQFLENASNHVMDSCNSLDAVWDENYNDAQGILQGLSNKMRAAASKLCR
jgi:hypothetical protein